MDRREHAESSRSAVPGKHGNPVTHVAISPTAAHEGDARNSNSTVFEEERSIAKLCTDDELDWRCERYEIELATTEMRWAGVADPDVRASTVELDRFLASERLRALLAEQELRRWARLAPDGGNRYAERSAAWTELAREVAERTDIVELLTRSGYPLTRRGRDARRSGGYEWNGPICPNCGAGNDRLVVFDGPRGRAWCRNCRWSADSIAVAMTILQCGFREAVAALAEALAIRAEVAS